MADFNKVIDHTLQWEGGLVDHPSDPGGLTNRGITIGTFRTWAKKILGIEPTEQNLRSLTTDQAKAIYRAVFWDGVQGDAIRSQDVAHQLFDMYVNATSVAVKLMQHILNVRFGQGLTVDGGIGPKTIAAINAVNPAALHDFYKDARAKYYLYRSASLDKSDSLYPFFQSLNIRERADQQVFLKGWLNRVLSFPDLLKKKSVRVGSGLSVDLLPV